jgi:transposase
VAGFEPLHLGIRSAALAVAQNGDADVRIPPPQPASPVSVDRVRQKLAPCLIGIEACALSHHWSRELQALGHTVRLFNGSRPAEVLRGCPGGPDEDTLR